MPRGDAEWVQAYFRQKAITQYNEALNAGILTERLPAGVYPTYRPTPEDWKFVHEVQDAEDRTPSRVTQREIVADVVRRSEEKAAHAAADQQIVVNTPDGRRTLGELEKLYRYERDAFVYATDGGYLHWQDYTNREAKALKLAAELGVTVHQIPGGAEVPVGGVKMRLTRFRSHAGDNVLHDFDGPLPELEQWLTRERRRREDEAQLRELQEQGEHENPVQHYVADGVGNLHPVAPPRDHDAELDRAFERIRELELKLARAEAYAYPVQGFVPERPAQ
jgi:hypothetical protein